MYLRGSKWTMNRRKRRVSFWRIGLLGVLILAAVYVNQIVVPETGPLFVPTATPTRDPASYAVDAQKAVEEGKYTQAIDSYKKAIQSNPNNPSNYIAVARLQIFDRDYESALENTKNALLLTPTSSMAVALQGWAQFFLADYLAAESSLKSAIDLDPNNALAHAFYAELLGKQIAENKEVRIGGMELAISESQRAVELGPDEMETHRARAYVLEWTANYAEAIQEFEKAISINKNIADLHLELGNIYSFYPPDAPQYDQAVDEFNKAIPLNPTDPLPKVYMAGTYARIGEYAKAIQFAEEALKNDPSDPYIYGNLGTYYWKTENYQNAADNLRLTIQGGVGVDGATEVKGLPLSYDVKVMYYYSAYGLALAKQNKCSEAIPVAQAIINGVPENEDTVYNGQAILDTCKQQIEGTWTPTSEPAADTTPSP